MTYLSTDGCVLARGVSVCLSHLLFISFSSTYLMVTFQNLIFPVIAPPLLFWMKTAMV